MEQKLKACWQGHRSVCEAMQNHCGKWQVFCGACGSSTGTCKTQEGAILAWNTRAADEENSRLREALENLLVNSAPICECEPFITPVEGGKVSHLCDGCDATHIAKQALEENV